MAVLTATQLAELRRIAAAEATTVTWNKPQVNAVLQAVEDWWEASRASLGTAMEVAAPGVFNAARKKALGKYWLWQKYGRGG